MGLCHYVLPRVGHQATSKTQKSWFLTQHSLPTPHSFLWPWIFQPEMRIVQMLIELGHFSLASQR